MSSSIVVPVITYQILYKDTDIKLINFDDFKVDATEFKKSLKELLEKSEDKTKIQSFITQLVIVATKNIDILTDTAGTGDKFPFIFVIDNTNGDKVQRTYLTFSGDNANPKVNFNQYNVETTIKPDIDKAFEVLIEDNYKYSYYNGLLPPATAP
jgi:hypothetical protein